MKVPESLLRLTVDVLTSKSCSEEGLEDTTALLLNLSHISPSTCQEVSDCKLFPYILEPLNIAVQLTWLFWQILELLLGGAQEMGQVIKEHIHTLLVELRQWKRNMDMESGEEDKETLDVQASSSHMGTLLDRYDFILLKQKGGKNQQSGI